MEKSPAKTVERSFAIVKSWKRMDLDGCQMQKWREPHRGQSNTESMKSSVNFFKACNMRSFVSIV